jgi:hypothetical protein
MTPWVCRAYALVPFIVACGGGPIVAAQQPSTPDSKRTADATAQTQPDVVAPVQPPASSVVVPAQPAATLPAPAPLADTSHATCSQPDECAQNLARLQQQTSSQDCTAACAALAALDRTAGEYCAIAPSERQCSAVRARVRAARKRVRSACNSCPVASVDETDPVPAP